MRWERVGGTLDTPTGGFVDIAPDGSRFLAIAIEPSPRGFKTSVWGGSLWSWRSAAVLGFGEARAVCVGAHGATAVAVSGDNPNNARLLAWTRSRSGRWSSEPDVVATGADPRRCVDGRAGAVIVGTNRTGAATTWRRPRPDAPWGASVVAASAPQTTIDDVVRDGSGFLASGSAGGRGQVDLGLWRSRDGLRWTRVGGAEPAFVEPGFQVGLGLVSTRGRIVVVGRHGAGDAGLWVGTP
jgi:hypothetical protein